VWYFTIGLLLWTAVLLWIWGQVGRSLHAPVPQKEKEQARTAAPDSDASFR